MSIKINSSDNIKGFTKDIINKFCKSSGMKLNIEKTEAILLGTLKNKNNSLYGVKSTNEPITCLGIYLRYDSKIFYEKKNLE
jgi:hypothetical protein